jgi:Na+/melibiose symporter-like transporter
VLILVVGAVLVAAFVFVESRASEPIMPLWVFRRRLLITSSLVSFGVGGILLGLSSYIPTFVQDVLGTGPLVAGFALATLTMGWPLSASQAGRVYLRIGVRGCALIGGALVIVGSGLLLLLNGSSPVVQVGGTCFVIGLGMGLVAAPTLIAAQSSVGWNERGVVTGTNLFSRSLGSALGVAIFGAVANGALGSASSAVQAAHTDAARLSGAIHHVFIAVAVLAVLMVAVVTLMPRRLAQAEPEPIAPELEEQAA